MTKIVKLQIENAMGVEVVEITPEGSMIVIGGDNGHGKSSILNSIAMVLGGRKFAPKEPLRQGTDSGKVVLDLGEMVLRLIFTNEKWKLRLESADGAPFPSPQAMLDEFYSVLTFDPLLFANEKDAKKRRAMLLDVLGIDFTENRIEYAREYEKRRDVNRDRKALVARVNASPSHEDTEAVDTNKLWVALEAAENNERQAEHNNANTRHARDRTAQLEVEIADLKVSLAQYAELAKMEETPIPTDAAAIRASIQQADDTNQKVRENEEHASLQKELDGLDAVSAAHGANLDALDAEMQQAIASAKMPVSGIGITDDGLTFNGVPFEQASAAEQLRVSVAMGFAMNPKLKILLIRDGSLLDAGNMKLVQKMADAVKDAQIWIERVGEGKECSVIMEDGMVKK